MVFDRRNGIYRSIVIAAFGWLSLAASPPEQSAQRNKPASESASQSDLSRVASAIEKLPQAQAPDTGCKPGQDNRDSDLCAQWKAADGAYASAIWTERTFWLGVVGVAIGGLTLFFASSAAHWAKEAATETKRSADAADAAHKSFIAAERALLVITRFDIQTGQQGDAYFIGLLTVKNCGASNAFLKTVEISESAKPQFSGQYAHPIGVGGIVGAGESLDVDGIVIERPTTDPAYLTIRVGYSTIGGNGYYTCECYQAYIWSGNQNNFATTREQIFNLPHAT
jgi:hypothetical protein